MQVIVHGLKEEVEAAPLPILHFTLDIWTSKVSGDKYLGMHIFWADSNFSVRHAEIGVSCRHMPYWSMRGVLNYWQIFPFYQREQSLNYVLPLALVMPEMCVLVLLGSYCIRPLHHHGVLS